MYNGISIVIPLSNPLQQKNDIMHLFENQHLEPDIEIEVLLVAAKWEEYTRKKIIENCLLSGITVRFITEFRSSQAFARESGIRLARYELVCLLRTDSNLPENALQIGRSIMTKTTNLGACAGNLLLRDESFDIPSPSSFLHTLTQAWKSDSIGEYPDSSVLNVIFIRKQAWCEMYEKGFFLHLAQIDNSIFEDHELFTGIKLCGWRVAIDRQLSAKPLIDNERLLYKRLLKIYQMQGKADPILECYRLNNQAQAHSELWWQEFFQISRLLLNSMRSLIKYKNVDRIAWFKFHRRLTAWIMLFKLYPSFAWHSHQIKIFTLRAKSLEMQKEKHKVINSLDAFLDTYAPLQT